MVEHGFHEAHQYTENDYCTPGEVLRIIRAVPQVSRHPERDALLINVGWETGGRISEVLGLVPERILETSIVLVNLKQPHKNGKLPTKIVEVSDVLCDWIRKYCKKEDIRMGHWLFWAPRQRAEQLSRFRVQEMLTRASEAAGVFRMGKANPRTGGRYKGISFHVLRHSYATFLLKKTGNIRMVQQQLGHANITSTQKYANIAFMDVRASVAAAGVNLYHPR